MTSNTNFQSAIEAAIDGAASSDFRLFGHALTRAQALRRPENVNVGGDKTLNNFKYNNYTIATISYPVTVEHDGTVYPINHERIRSKKYLQLKVREYDHFDVTTFKTENIELVISAIEHWCDNIMNDCRNVIRHKPNFIVINELGYPPFSSGRFHSIAYRDRARIQAMRLRLEAILQTFAIENEVVIICGTHHDIPTFHNSGPIFFPHEASRKDHAKLTNAYAVGEYSKPARGVIYPVYDLGKVRFSVFVCSDAFDLNVFCSLIYQDAHGIPDNKPELVFIPSFHDCRDHENHSMFKTCQQLSLFTDSIVTFVNQSASKKGRCLFIGGHEVDPYWQDDRISVFKVDDQIILEKRNSNKLQKNQIRQMFNSI